MAEILQPSGRLDAEQAPHITQWLENHTGDVIINLEAVTFIDSMGLATLVKAMKRRREQGYELALCGVQANVRVIFELTRLDKAFQIFDNEAEAIKAIRGTGSRTA